MTDQRSLTAPITAANQSVTPSVTLYSTKSLNELLTPALVKVLDPATLVVPDNMPNSPALIAHLRKAATAHNAALIPASADEIARALAMLSTATIPWADEDERKVKLGMELLKRGLSHVPLDLLNAGIARYIGQPGRRFFPKSPGELLEFIKPALDRRASRAHRLDRIADELEKRATEERRRAEQDRSWTPESVAAANDDFRRAGVRTRYRYVGEGLPPETVMLPAGVEG